LAIKSHVAGPQVFLLLLKDCLSIHVDLPLGAAY
jgi:hypothetical protein